MIVRKAETNQIELDAFSRDELRIFLNSKTGLQLVQLLAIRAPKLIGGSDATAIIEASGTRKGYEECIENIFELSVPIQRTGGDVGAGSYPSLDDEKSWVETADQKSDNA